jgi:hypothetical protein
MDHYLKFSDESEMLAVLFDAEIIQADEDGNAIVPPYHKGAAIDVVGLIVDAPAVIDDDGNVITPATFVDGWHVNWRGDLPESLQGYAIDAPATPARVWA